jgi:hypothetical protein
MPDFILPSKLVGEKIEVEFDFRNELQWKETIHSWACSVEVLTGDDGSPNDMLAGQPTPIGYVVTQKFYKGLPGVIYTLICTITGSTGSQYKKTAKLAILPDSGMNPPFFAVFYSTRPYPVDVLEEMQVSVLPLSGRLQPQPFPIEYMQAFAPVFLAGSLAGEYQDYIAPAEDFYSTSVEFLSGDVYGSAKAYTGPAESMSAGMEFLSGTLVGEYLAYIGLPESISVSTSFISGTLE